MGAAVAVRPWQAGVHPAAPGGEAILGRRPQPGVGSLALLSLPREALEELVARARRDEDEIRAELKLQRRLGFRTWYMAESEGGMRALYRWVRDGPKSVQSSGIYLKGVRLYQSGSTEGGCELGAAGL